LECGGLPPLWSKLNIPQQDELGEACLAHEKPESRLAHSMKKAAAILPRVNIDFSSAAKNYQAASFSQPLLSPGFSARCAAILSSDDS
jgi:hypothetical protein